MLTAANGAKGARVPRRLSRLLVELPSMPEIRNLIAPFCSDPLRQPASFTDGHDGDASTRLTPPRLTTNGETEIRNCIT